MSAPSHGTKMSRIAQPALPQPLSELSRKRSRMQRNQTTSAAIQMKNQKLHSSTCPKLVFMDSMTTSFGQVLLWSFWFFIWIAALVVWFRCILDLFRDSSLSGWGKAGWAILLIFVPWLGALIYLIARGRSMTDRQMAKVADMQAQQTKYIQEVAGSSQ